MKKVLLFLLAVSPWVSFGGSLVCSGPQIYSSHVRHDFGVQPLNGMVLGKDVIALDGEILLNHTAIQGLGLHSIRPYDLELEGERTQLEKLGNEIGGSEIFKQEGVLVKRNSTGPANPQEVAREEVVCKRTWAMVP